LRVTKKKKKKKKKKIIAVPIRYVIRPESDKFDNRNYQVPADIADNNSTDNTTLLEPLNKQLKPCHVFPSP